MAPPEPRQLMYLFEWFNTITRARQDITAISWTEIDAWARLAQMTIEPWEIEVILRLDRVWLSVCREKGHPFEEIEDEHKAAQDPLPEPLRQSVG